jgi:Flp pilus assembly protein TadD
MSDTASRHPPEAGEPLALLDLARSMAQRGDIAGAVEVCGRAVALRPDFWTGYLERACLLLNAGNFAAAVADFQAVLSYAPAHVGALLDLGRAHHALGQIDAARACFERITTIDPTHAEGHYNLGVLAWHAGRTDEAIAHCTQAITSRPDFVIAYSNLAVALEAAGRSDEALEILDRAIARQPNHASAYWNKALLLLREGRFEEGWKYYEWRWAAGKAGVLRRYPGRPLWLGGTPIAGKTVFIHAEQGLGDTIQFMRHVPMLAALGARIVMEVDPALSGLCRRLEGVEAVIAPGAKPPAFDVHCPLMSLPLIFGTTIQTIPVPIPYVVAEPGRLLHWEQRLGARPPRRVGLVWRGNPLHDADAVRSMPFETLREALVPGIEYVSLQKSHPIAERRALRAMGGIKTPAIELRDFDDTAAVIAGCDVVISVDTAVAHLAGAMGKPVWLALPHPAEWRWLKDRNDTPWYPTMRLFRQNTRGDWRNVVDALRAELSGLADGGG